MSNIEIVGNINNTQIINRFNNEDNNLLSYNNVNSNFNKNTDYIELYIKDDYDNILLPIYNYTLYNNIENQNESSIIIDPVEDSKYYGFDEGLFFLKYNFFKKLLGNINSSQLFIKQISQDRTELLLSSTSFSIDDFNTFKKYFDDKSLNSSYYYTFLLNFNNDIQLIGTNVDIINEDLAIKLYYPLPEDINEKTTLCIVEEIINSYLFDVDITKEIIPEQDTSLYLKPANFNIPFNKNNIISSEYKSYNQLSSSLSSILSNLVNRKDSQINIDYSNPIEFSKFGSVGDRINIFFDKIKKIQTTNVTGSIISSFDNFELYLYNNSSSVITSSYKISDNNSEYKFYIAPYPKESSIYPYTQSSYTSSNAQTWITSSYSTATFYDTNNPETLYNLIPEYIKNDPNNNSYNSFVNMLGQFYDSIWLYINNITDIWDNTNDPNKGISPDLIYDWINSLGVSLYSIQQNSSLSSWYGTNLSGSSVFNPNDFKSGSSFMNNYSNKDIQTEMYKKIYHNIIVLLKSKGAWGNFYNFINIFGVTGSLLNIKEYSNNINNTLGYDLNKIYISNNPLYADNYLSNTRKLSTFFYNYENLPIIDVSFSPQNYINKIISNEIGGENLVLLNAHILNTNYDIKTKNNIFIAQKFNYNDYGNVINEIINTPNWTYINDNNINYYPDLNDLRSRLMRYLFTSSFSYNLFNKSVEYYDNSLSSYLKDFKPVKSNLLTGITYKSPILERLKFSSMIPELKYDYITDGSSSISSISASYDSFYNNLNYNYKLAYFDGNLSMSYYDFNDYFIKLNNNPYFVPSSYIPEGLKLDNFNFIYNYTASFYENFYYHSGWLNPLINFAIDNHTGSIQSNQSSVLKSSKLNKYTQGDISLNNSSNFNRNSGKIGLFTQIIQDKYNSFYSNVVLKYLVDKSGGLTELNQKNENSVNPVKLQNWYDVQNIFKTNDNLIISLFDSTLNGNQKNINGSKLILESGYSYNPIFYMNGSMSVDWNKTASFIGPDLGPNFFNVLDAPISEDTIPIILNANSPAPIYHTNSISGNKIEVWDLYNQGLNNSETGSYFKTGSNNTSSYYLIPYNTYNFGLKYDINLSITPPSAGYTSSVNFTASFELWGSGSGGLNKINIGGSSGAVEWGSGINNLYNIITYKQADAIVQDNPSYDSTIIIPAGSSYQYDGGGVDIAQYDIIYYHYQGINVIYGAGQSGILSGYSLNNNVDLNYTIDESTWVTRIIETSQISNNPQSISLSNNLQITQNNLSLIQNSKLFFRLFLDSNVPITTTNFSLIKLTRKTPEAVDNIQLSTIGGDTIVYNPFISFNQNNNSIILTGSLSNIYNNNTLSNPYYFNPLNSSSYNQYSSSYNQYGDINDPFILNPFDRIVIRYDNYLQRPPFEYTIKSISISPTSTNIILNEDLSNYFTENMVDNFYSIIFLKKNKDETNIRLNYNKQTTGSTSYGIVISDDLNNDFLNNIDSITEQLKLKISNK